MTSFSSSPLLLCLPPCYYPLSSPFPSLGGHEMLWFMVSKPADISSNNKHQKKLHRHQTIL